MLTLLQQVVERGGLRALDLHFARLIANEEGELLLLLAAIVSAEAGEGHVCLPLHSFRVERLFAGRCPDLAAQIWQQLEAPDTARCLRVLELSTAVSDGQQPTPLVLQHQRLYLHRMWRDEGRIADYFSRDFLTVSDIAEAELAALLRRIFDSNQVNNGSARAEIEINWQKVAAAVAATSQVAVISGGPGTGKTTTVAHLLAALIELNRGKALRIVLAAPTGKAAARLATALLQSRDRLQLSPDLLAQFPQEAITLHRLLGAYGRTGKWHYHRDNPLHLDLLVVDEASMVDLPMMARLIEALPAQARLLLLGDRDQLASVETGAVLGDICRLLDMGYSLQRATQLSRLTGYALLAGSAGPAPPSRDLLCLLRKSYRFDQHSGIGRLAEAVNRGQSQPALALFSADYSDLAWYQLCDSDDYALLLQLCVQHYRLYLSLIANKAGKRAVLEQFSRFQLLCALREGPFGVNGLNKRIEQALYQQGVLQRSRGMAGRWYPGRPVMVSRNDRLLGLYNGDIGIVFPAEEGGLMVHFLLPDGDIRMVSPQRMPEHETAFAMTVHKSQGSEFEHTLLVLPDRFTPLLTRELLYTAITRARQQLTLFCTEKVFSRTINTVTERSSGLLARLQQKE